MPNNNTNNLVDLLCDAIERKSKRTFSYYGSSIKKQVLHFLPSYRDFLLKIINNSSLKIQNYSREGSFSYQDSQIDQYLEEFKKNPNPSKAKLSKRSKNIIYTDIKEINTLPHELGHAVDMWFGKNNELSSNVIVYKDKTLKEIFTTEFQSKKEQLFETVMNEYKNIINSNINNKAFDIFITNIDLYRKLQRLPVCDVNRKARKNIQNKLYKSGFVEVYYQILEKKCYSILNKKYGPILDALSSEYDLSSIFLSHHKKSYYSVENLPVQEFFANTFAAKVSYDCKHIDELIKLLPESFNAFERLFVTFYDRIQNNKRFTNLQVKER